MHAHRVEIFDRTDDDAVVGGVAHHFHFVFLPTQHRFLDQHFGGRRQIKTALGDFQEFFAVVGDSAAAAAKREARPDDGGVTDAGLNIERLLETAGDFRFRAIQADFGHGHTEQLAVFSHADGIG